MKRNEGMRHRPLISIVIPVFNAEKTIRDSLISLLNQTHRNIEIIIVNDGSTDATEAILNGLSREFSMQVINVEHRGRSSARNIGSDQAKGQIVAFAEADAKYHPDWITNAIRQLNHDKIAGVVGPRYCWIADTLVSKCIDLELRIRYHDPLYTPIAGWMYRKDVLVEVGGFDEQLKVAEDRDLGIRIKERGYTIIFEPDSIMWHMEPRSITELVKKTYTHSTERLYFYLKYPRKYPFIKVLSLITYILLIPLLSIINILLLLPLIGIIPVLILGQLLRLRVKAKRSKVERSNVYLLLTAIIDVIRNVLLALGSLNALKIYLWHKLSEMFKF